MITNKIFESSLFKLRYLNHSFEQIVAKELSQNLNLHLNEFMILTSFFADKDCIQKNLATHLKLSQAAVSKLVQHLVEKNLLNREIDPKNRRQYNFSLTLEAEKKVAKAQDLILNLWQNLFQEVDQKTQDGFNKTLTQLIKNLN
jgi:DNA-binding MarR family transcriptional regulator